MLLSVQLKESHKDTAFLSRYSILSLSFISHLSPGQDFCMTYCSGALLLLLYSKSKGSSRIFWGEMCWEYTVGVGANTVCAALYLPFSWGTAMKWVWPKVDVSKADASS